MAWLLAIAADVCLTGHERTMTFVELGCGENHLAIERILNAVMSSRMTLPVAIFDRLTRWLDGYADSPEEPRLRTMLAEIRSGCLTWQYNPEQVLRSVKCDFHPALITERAESANLTISTKGAPMNLATTRFRSRRCAESAIKPNRLEMS
jgi:hypothetical protein